MTIEILQTTIENDPTTMQPGNRAASVIASNGTLSFMLEVGNLPLTGNLQTILDARDAELFASAQARGQQVDLYEVTVKRVLRAFALVMLDEINIVRQGQSLPARTAAQAETALKAKLKSL